MVDISSTVNEENQQPTSRASDSETSISDPSESSLRSQATHVDLITNDQTTNTQESVNTEPVPRPTNTESYRNIAGQTRNFITFYLEQMNNHNASTENGEHPDEPLDAFAWRVITRPPIPLIFVVMAAVCILLTVVKELMGHLGLLLSLAVGVTHFQDNFKFSEIVKDEQTHSMIPIIVCMFLRNLINIVVAARFEIIQIAVLLYVPGGESCFVVTVCRIILAEICVADLALFIKVLMHHAPLNPSQKRRFNLFIDQSCYLYRMLVPINSWCGYFAQPFFFTCYILVKVYFIVTRIVVWFKLIGVVFFTVIVGEQVSPSEIEPESTCSICQNAFVAPRKMKCSHIFCANCITTWVETNKSNGNSCPLCRNHLISPKTLKISDFEEEFPINIF